MCSVPVTLGGGMAMVYVGRVSSGALLAWKKPCFSHQAYQRSSALAGTYSLGISASLMA